MHVKFYCVACNNGSLNKRPERGRLIFFSISVSLFLIGNALLLVNETNNCWILVQDSVVWVHLNLNSVFCTFNLVSNAYK